MKKERNKVIPAAFALLEKEGKVLLFRRFNTGYADGQYDLPAGHVEEGELPEETIVRELQEEIGVQTSSEEIEFIGAVYYLRFDANYIQLFFKVKNWTGEPTLQEPDKCDEVSWFSFTELPETTIFYIKEVIENYRSGKRVSFFQHKVL